MGRTTCFGSRECCFVAKYKMWKILLIAFVWCSIEIQVSMAGGAAGLHVWSKHKPEVQALLRKHQNYQRLLSTSQVSSMLHRRNGEHRTPTIPPPRSPLQVSRETDFNHLNSLLKSAKNFDSVPYVRRQLQNSNPWSSLYSSDNVHTSVKYVQPTSSNVQSKLLPVESKAPPHVVKNEKRVPANIVEHPSTKRLPEEFPSTVTSAKEFYKEMYSTEEGIRQLREEYGPTNLTQAKINYKVDKELEDVRLATEHFIQMRNSIRCHAPIPEVVCVKDVHVESDKEYLPRCTLLHRCGDRSGCCDSDDFHCAARVIQEVALNFYVVVNPLDYKPGEIQPENIVEKLLFENHTECECVHKSDVKVQSTSKFQSTTPSMSESTPVRRVSTSTTTESPQQPSHQSDDDHSHHHSDQWNEKKKFQKCGTCPNPFHHREYHDGRCGCDCFDKERPCIRIKRGREALPEPERRCVETARCHIPECEYGMFVTQIGRCPKRPEDYDKPGRSGKHHKNPSHEHHRWNFYERD